MKDIMLIAFRKGNVEILKAILLFIIMVLLWPIVQYVILNNDITAGYVDPSILVLIVLAMICFVSVLVLSWYLVRWFWMAMGLPGLGSMVLRFNELEIWQKLGFYFACYALLLLAGVGCLMAIL